MTASASTSLQFLRVTLCPSRYLLIFILSSHGLAATAVMVAALPLWLVLLSIPVIALSGAYSLLRHWWTGERILNYQQGDWSLTSGGQTLWLNLVGESLVTPWLLVLRFRGDKSVRGEKSASISLVLPSDSADADDLRRLRVLLNFGLKQSQQSTVDGQR